MQTQVLESLSKSKKWHAIYAYCFGVFFDILIFFLICLETAAINSNMQECYWKYILVCRSDEVYALYKHCSFREVSKHNELKAF